MTQLMTLILLFATSSFALADEKSAHAMHEADVFTHQYASGDGQNGGCLIYLGLRSQLYRAEHCQPARRALAPGKPNVIGIRSTQSPTNSCMDATNTTHLGMEFSWLPGLAASEGDRHRRPGSRDLAVVV